MDARVPLIITTSPVTEWTLPGYFRQLEWHTQSHPNPLYDRVPRWCDVHVFGFSEDNPSILPDYAQFHIIGAFADYPHGKWSDAFLKVLDWLEAAGHKVFWFMLDDYWIVRGVDVDAVRILHSFMLEHEKIAKIDLAFDRLYADPGRYQWYNETVATVGHLDLIESVARSNYHMSLWGGLFSTRMMRELIEPGWSAQDVEIKGTPKLSKMAYHVLGTRQAPVLHTNVIHNHSMFNFPGPPVPENDMFVLRQLGYTNGL